MSQIKLWRFAGTFAIISLGFLLHYLYLWSGSSKIVGSFVPVNESVWEHLKLGYWSIALFSIVEFFHLNNSVNNYYFAKFNGFIILEMTILVIYYSYTFIVGRNILFMDIFSFIVGVVLCQYLTYSLFKLKPLSMLLNRASLVAFMAIGILFGVITYYTPHAAIFMDKRTKTYGMNKEI